jgi:malate/lactate dehydrogenase
MKIGIIGCGFVGSSGAFAIALEGKANELIRIMKMKGRLEK